MTYPNAKAGGQWAALFAVSWAASNYFLFISLQPVLFGALVGVGHLTLASASTILSANLLGAIVGNFAVLFRVRLLRTKLTVALGAAVLAVTQMLAGFLPSTSWGLLV